MDNLNHTAGAITARDEDEDRVNAYVDSMLGQYPLAFKMPFKGAECRSDATPTARSCTLCTIGENPRAHDCELRRSWRCRHVVDRLIKSFYRHPGTALYLKMVSGYVSPPPPPPPPLTTSSPFPLPARQKQQNTDKLTCFFVVSRRIRTCTKPT